MATIETSKEIQQTHKPHKVYARAKWRDEWVEQPNLYCDWFEKSAGPEVSRAALFWKYGRGIQPGKTTFENYSPKSLLWRYIKIVAEPSTDSTESEAKPIEWYGIVTDDQRALDGDLTHDGKKLENGDQVLGAVGMEVLLTKFTIEQSYVGTTEDSTEIDRGLTFNANIGSVYKGNRNSLGDGENFFFCKKASEGDHWNIGQVVQYLVDTWLFRNASAVSSDLVWELDADDAIAAAAAFRVMIPAQGRSVKQLLDACFDRRRLLGYTVDVVPGDDGAPEKMSIRGFTFVKTTIELEEQDDLPAATFRANPSSDLDFSTAFDVLDAQVRRDARSSYSQVVVRGARLTSCWSCSSGTILVPGWSDDQAESYQAGASGESDYPADELEKLLRDSEFRKNDAILQPAFRQFVIAQDWNGKKGDNAVWPDMNQPEFDATLAAPFWRPGLTLDRELPLRVGVDYSETKIKDDEETSFNPDDREADYVAPMCLIPLPESETRYVLCEKAGSVKAGGAADAEEAEPPYTWSADVRMLHEDAGVDLRVENAPQHIICSAEFDQELDSDIEPEVDWNDFIFVLAGKSDQFVKVAWPKTPPPAAPEPSEDELKERGPDAPSIVDPEINSVLTIEMEDAECWYVVPDTVVGVKDGVPQKSTSGGFIRDDRPRMERLAKLAYGFYAVPRRAFLLTYRQISGLFTVGQMIGTVKSGEKTIDVGSVVTSVRWDLKQGLTIVSTDHAELDERSFS